MALLFSTVSASVTLQDLGGFTLVHPAVDVDMEAKGFTREELIASQDARAALDAGTLTAKGDEGQSITTSAGLVSLSVNHDLLAHTDLAGAPPSDGQAIVYSSALGKARWGAPAGLGDPRVVLLGTRLDYTVESKFSTNFDIQYTQVFLSKGDTLDKMRIRQVNIGGDVRFGVYNQATPSDPDGEPVTKVAETAKHTLVVAGDGSNLTLALLSQYVVPSSGYYWLALTCSSSSVKFMSTPIVPANYLPWRQQAGGSSPSTNLPTTVGTLTRPAEAIGLLEVIRL